MIPGRSFRHIAVISNLLELHASCDVHLLKCCHKAVELIQRFVSGNKFGDILIHVCFDVRIDRAVFCGFLRSHGHVGREHILSVRVFAASVIRGPLILVIIRGLLAGIQNIGDLCLHIACVNVQAHGK